MINETPGLVYFTFSNLMLDSQSGVYLKTIAWLDRMKQPERKVEAYFISKSSESNIVEHNGFIQVSGDAAFISHYLHQRLLAFPSQRVSLVVRYHWASEFVIQVLTPFSGRIIFEHNTIEDEEAIMMQKKHVFGSKKLYSFGWWRYWFKTFVLHQTPEKKWGPELLKMARSGVCVTSEIANYEKLRRKDYSTRVISNGLLPIEVIYPRAASQSVIRFFMLVGSDEVWNGYDRFIESLRLGKHHGFLEFHVFGKSAYSEEVGKNYKVVFRPKLAFGELRKALVDFHFSVGTLALYRKGMRVAAPLKVRESMMMGFPVLLGYHDEEIQQAAALQPYTFTVPNDSSLLDLSAIEKYYQEVISPVENHPLMISSEACKHFSIESKSKEWSEYLDQLT